jgi:nitroreductase
MNVYQAIENRFSVRAFEDRPVDEDVLRRILEAGLSAPTARNRQEFRLVVVRDEKIRGQLGAAADQNFVAKAPVILAAVGLTPEQTMFCKVPTDPVDCAIVLDHVSLAATAKGLGTCWIGHFDQNRARKILNVPAGAVVIELMVLGYPRAERPQRKRKAFDELIRYESFE